MFKWFIFLVIFQRHRDPPEMSSQSTERIQGEFHSYLCPPHGNQPSRSRRHVLAPQEDADQGHLTSRGDTQLRVVSKSQDTCQANGRSAYQKGSTFIYYSLLRIFNL